MAPKSYDLEFEGYWREVRKGGIKSYSGVYCVYTCVYNKPKKKGGKGSVSIKKLVYIGETGDIRERVDNHEKWPEWKEHLAKEQQICFSCCHVASTDRERVEAALIFEHKPPVNEEYKDSFPFDKTTIRTSGRNAKLKNSFTVERTE